MQSVESEDICIWMYVVKVQSLHEKKYSSKW